jgi:hypothetical protein
MPLPYDTTTDLQIPAGAFNNDGLAVLLLQGGRYGGDWTVVASGGPERDTWGEFCTSIDDRRKRALLTDPGYPDRAAETAFIWLMDQAKRQGLRVVGWECMNSHYGPGEAPYFCAAQAIVANESFVPAEGVIYADGQTLDAVMGYTS